MKKGLISVGILFVFIGLLFVIICQSWEIRDMPIYSEAEDGAYEVNLAYME